MKGPSTPPSVPTIGQLATDDDPGWFWAHCPLPCCHSAAIPWEKVIPILGAESSSDRLRRALRCTVCGHKGATIRRPTWQVPHPKPTIPMESVPAWARPFHPQISPP